MLVEVLYPCFLPPLCIRHSDLMILFALDGELPCPLSCCSLVSGTVGLVDVGDFGYKRVVGVRVGKHRAYGQKD